MQFICGPGAVNHTSNKARSFKTLLLHIPLCQKQISHLNSSFFIVKQGLLDLLKMISLVPSLLDHNKNLVAEAKTAAAE